MSSQMDLIKKLREETGVSIMECKKAVEETNGDMERAKKVLAQKGIEKAAKKADRETKQGVVASYIHANSQVGAMVELYCETDFVARTSDFKNLAHEICMQVAAMNPANKEDLENQVYIRDNSVKISDLVKKSIAKLGENIKIGKFLRLSLND